MRANLNTASLNIHIAIEIKNTPIKAHSGVFDLGDVALKIKALFLAHGKCDVNDSDVEETSGVSSTEDTDKRVPLAGKCLRNMIF